MKKQLNEALEEANNVMKSANECTVSMEPKYKEHLEKLQRGERLSEKFPQFETTERHSVSDTRIKFTFI
jgi:hypothetical protein